MGNNDDDGTKDIPDEKPDDTSKKRTTTTGENDNQEGKSHPSDSRIDPPNSSGEGPLPGERGGVTARPYRGITPTPIATFLNAQGDVIAYEITDAKVFHELISAAKKESTFGACMEVYSIEDFAQKRMFITPDGMAGFTLEHDDEMPDMIVLDSVFKSEKRPDDAGPIGPLIQLVIDEGACAATCYDTILPDYYAAYGFRGVARNEWNDEFAPEDWDKELYFKFNKGEPDVAFIVLDKNRVLGDFKDYTHDVKPSLKDYAPSWDDGVAAQRTAFTKIRAAEKKAAIPSEIAASSSFKASSKFFPETTRYAEKHWGSQADNINIWPLGNPKMGDSSKKMSSEEQTALLARYPHTSSESSYAGIVAEPLDAHHVPFNNILGVEGSEIGKRTAIVSVGQPGGEYLMVLPEARLTTGIVGTIVTKLNNKTTGKSAKPSGFDIPAPTADRIKALCSEEQCAEIISKRGEASLKSGKGRKQGNCSKK